MKLKSKRTSRPTESNPGFDSVVKTAVRSKSSHSWFEKCRPKNTEGVHSFIKSDANISYGHAHHDGRGAGRWHEFHHHVAYCIRLEIRLEYRITSTHLTTCQKYSNPSSSAANSCYSVIVYTACIVTHHRRLFTTPDKCEG